MFVGLALDFCVRYSAEDAVSEGFEAMVVTDAARAIEMNGSLDAAVKALRACGVDLVRAS